MWFSRGAASAVAAKLAVQKYPPINELAPDVGVNEPDGDIECGPFCVQPELSLHY